MTLGSAPVATLHDTGLAGCFEVRFRPFRDARGLFMKTYHEPAFQALGLGTDWKEEFVSTSAKGVIRGMYFQVPPVQHAKLVICLVGRVLDVVVDLREGSATFGTCCGIELSEERGNAMYIPEGFAHGFLALENHSTLLYKVSSVHSPAHDQGLRWDTIGFEWPVVAPILSPRDAGFGALATFQTPFRS